ncbi:hypothetical protein RB4813 [Rhodopirellula baltica SH 1]|uniref:Uncharacterized protein n=1 Tax=Rhodopirellula baltica (strain DSM 10527 / NCIMB 13988 / SH1) TaxID=243090 RepID=Q7UH65_RHOBA|nr:hypothetical protein RB4813 [Rhodopirellula baltica SH 1]
MTTTKHTKALLRAFRIPVNEIEKKSIKKPSENSTMPTPTFSRPRRND